MLIAVLLTCYNRKEKTLKSLSSVFSQDGLGNEYNIEVFLVDDGSTDGTNYAINNQFPKVNIIAGDGNLFWNRGMCLAWQTAANANKKFDYYLWLNDDTFLNSDAINILLIGGLDNSIICGTTISKKNNKLTYGGYSTSKKKLISPNGVLQECDYFNGNCVLIPHKVFELVGNLDSIFHHALGDFDYGLRARKLGVKLYVSSEVIGNCDNHPNLPKWCNPEENIFNRIKHLYSPLSGCCPTQFLIFDYRHNGVFIAILHFFSIHLRVIWPSLWKQRK